MTSPGPPHADQGDQREVEGGVGGGVRVLTAHLLPVVQHRLVAVVAVGNDEAPFGAISSTTAPMTAGSSTTQNRCSTAVSMTISRPPPADGPPGTAGESR